jgi:uncharacterized protein (TIGR03067 family)
MKTFILAAGLMLVFALAARADEKTDLSGNYTVVSGKKEGKDIDEKAKKMKYTVTADTFTIEGPKSKMVISYKVKPGTTPMEIDMAVLEGPDGTKNAPAFGIVEVKGDTLKLAYSMEKEKRPKDFDGKAGYLIELKKAK